MAVENALMTFERPKRYESLSFPHFVMKKIPVNDLFMSISSNLLCHAFSLFLHMSSLFSLIIKLIYPNVDIVLYTLQDCSISQVTTTAYVKSKVAGGCQNEAVFRIE